MSDEQKKNIDSETSVGNYLLKQVYQQVVMWGGMLGGAMAGYVASAPFLKNMEPMEGAQKLWQQFPKIAKVPFLKTPAKAGQLVGSGVGFILGSMTAGIILGYGHWKKIKQAQMQVDEITKNISDIEVFKKTDPELKAENTRLWNELHARDKGRDVAPMVSVDMADKPAKTIEKSDVQLHGKAAPLAGEIAV